jgi:hypothetical protein
MLFSSLPPRQWFAGFTVLCGATVEDKVDFLFQLFHFGDGVRNSSRNPLPVVGP